jgi:hypothetical protein
MVKKPTKLDEVILDKQPPVILILKRKTVRAFPDGMKVALYHNSKLGISFTLPFDDDGHADQQSGLNASFHEEVELKESAALAPWDAIKTAVATRQYQTIKFPDGSKMKLDGWSAQCIMNVYDHLSDDNKTKLIGKVNSGRQGFIKIADFCFKQHQG